MLREEERRGKRGRERRVDYGEKLIEISVTRLSVGVSLVATRGLQHFCTPKDTRLENHDRSTYRKIGEGLR